MYILLFFFLLLTSCVSNEIANEKSIGEGIIYTVDMEPSILCELPEKEKRKFIFKLYKEHLYKECKDVWDKNIWFKCVAECSEKGLGHNVGGGCGHLVISGYECSYNPGQPEHCNSFRTNPKIGLLQDIRENYIKYCAENGYVPEK